MVGTKEGYAWKVESFGAHLERSGWKQLALAAATGVLQQTISRLKHGQDYMSEDAAARLAPKFFHTTVTDLRLAHNLYVFHRRHEAGNLSPYDQEIIFDAMHLSRTYEQRAAVKDALLAVMHDANDRILSRVFLLLD